MSSTKQAKMMAAHHFDASSSPDPLNEALIDQRQFISPSPSKRRTSQTAKSTQRKTSAPPNGTPTSSTRQTTQNAISPSKTITEQTLSPWKIRVTVEAEPEEHGTTEMMQTYTKTTTIPLRGDSSPLQTIETASPGRGRRVKSQPRSRASSISKTRQRSGTPNAGRRRRQSVTDLDIVVLGDDDDEDEWGRENQKSATRKKSTKSRRTSVKTAEKSKRISSIIDDFDISEDPNTERDHSHHEVLHSESPELRQIDLNKVSIRQRSNSTKQKAKDVQPNEEIIPSKETETMTEHQSFSSTRKYSANSTRSYPTPSPTPSEPDQPVLSVSDDAHNEGYDTVIESEGFTMIDLDSIPSVRQLRSSPAEQSQKGPEQNALPDAEQEQASLESSPQKAGVPTPGRTFPSYLYLAADESDISSAVPSSPPFNTSQLKGNHKQDLNHLQIPSSASQSRDRKVTPQTYSSPSLPSPPRPAPPQKRDDPDSSQAMEAGMRLQGAVDSRSLNQQVHSRAYQPLNTRDVRSAAQQGNDNGLFEGFDLGTQRELRAGLRFGEELAKKRATNSGSTMAPNIPLSLNSQPQIWRVHQIGPQHRTSNRAEYLASSNGKSARRSSLLNQSINVSDLSSISMADTPTKPSTGGNGIEEERQYGSSDVLNHTHETGSSDVLNKRTVIVEDQTEQVNQSFEVRDVTMEDADEDDIWLAEAKESSSSPPGAHRSEKTTRTEGKGQPDTNKQNFQHPRRALNTAPWNRADRRDQDANNTTIMSNCDGESSVSGLLWRAPGDREHDIRFGAGQIKETRRVLRQSGVSAFDDRSGSGAFDVGKMLATPKRIRESLEKQETETADAESQPSPWADEETFDESDLSAQIDDSSIPSLPQTVPVRFNDSSSDLGSSPYKTRRSLSPSVQRPPTPRSAMKGTRFSLGPDTMALSTDNSDGTSRRVAWAKRSNHMDEDWLESSRSMISTDSITGPQTGDPPREAAITASETFDQNSTQASVETTSSAGNSEEKTWLSWLRSGKNSSNPDSQPIKNVSSTLSELNIEDKSQSAEDTPDESAEWQQTSNNSSSTGASTRQLASHNNNKPKRVKVPSYLLAPSYPSDPKRSIAKPLATSGEFTNIHFRTLHIIYAKSSRPRFHAPQIEECRPEIRKLVTNKWQMDVDEEHAGLGGFTFKVGEDMGRTLERFCREVEWGYLSPMIETGELVITDLLNSDGIWEAKAMDKLESNGNGTVTCWPNGWDVSSSVKS